MCCPLTTDWVSLPKTFLTSLLPAHSPISWFYHTRETNSAFLSTRSGSHYLMIGVICVSIQAYIAAIFLYSVCCKGSLQTAAILFPSILFTIFGTSPLNIYKLSCLHTFPYYCYLVLFLSFISITNYVMNSIGLEESSIWICTFHFICA